ncbi:GRIP and coiled-coil domain-containing protein 2-like [Gouania willdenowi]|uniref:GRIP and coiled-coil domain-containing protein 2-like n=1 Tax=Gouania willdenowi TaxID=441366 RepID=UPI00105523B0|nr:GRIP and coiled-coil domain-containing protein 2-like [Gouania willdenowi]
MEKKSPTKITAHTKGSSGKLPYCKPSSNKTKKASFHQKGTKNQVWKKKDCHSFNEPENNASKFPQTCTTEEPADLNQSAAAPWSLSETQHAEHYGSDFRPTLEPAKPKCSECGRWRKNLSKKDQEQMLNWEKEMDSILQIKNNEITNLLFLLDQAQQELKDNDQQWEIEIEKMINEEKETNCIVLNQKLEISKLHQLLNQAQQDKQIEWEENNKKLKEKEEEISQFSSLVEDLKNELKIKNSQLEDSLQNHKEESTSLKLKLGELREEVQAQKKQLDREKAALVDNTNELQNKEQLFLKQKAEAEKNIRNMNSVLKQNKRRINKQLKTISHLEATLKKQENNFKTRTDQLMVENKKALKAIMELEARCENESQSKQKQVQLQTALDEAEKRLVEMEEERSNHIMTIAILRATLTETEETFKNALASIQEQKQEKEKATSKKKPFWKWFRNLTKPK